MRGSEQALSDRYPRLFEARRQSPFMMKLIDPVVLAQRGANRDPGQRCAVLPRAVRAPRSRRARARGDVVVPAGSVEHLQPHRGRCRIGVRHPSARTRQQRHRGRSTNARRLRPLRAAARASGRAPAQRMDRADAVRALCRGARPCRIPVARRMRSRSTVGSTTVASPPATSPDPAARCSPKRACRTPRFTGVWVRTPMAKLWALRALWRMFRYLAELARGVGGLSHGAAVARPAVQTRLRAQSRTRRRSDPSAAHGVRQIGVRIAGQALAVPGGHRSQHRLRDARPCVERSAREG